MAVNPFQNLGSTFQAQQNQSALSSLLSDEQFKLIQALNDPTTNLALAKQTADARASYPQLKTEVSAPSGIREGLMHGLSNAVANGQEIAHHNQKVQAYEGLQQQALQIQAQQRELTMGHIAQQQQREVGAQNYLQGNNPGLAGAYQYLDPAGRQSALSGVATKELGLQYKPLEGTAEGQSQVNKGQAINTAVGQMKPVEVGGIPQARQIDAVHNVQGYAPTTTVDVNKGLLDNSGKLIGNQVEANKLGVQPQQLQQDIQKNALDIQTKRVEAQFAEQEKVLAVKRDQLANQKGTVDYNKALKEYQRFDQGQQLFKTLQESGTLNTSDPQKQSEIQAQLGIYGVKYDPPNTKYTTIKHKDGAVYQFDNTNNKVRALIDRGGKPSYGPWQELSE